MEQVGRRWDGWDAIGSYHEPSDSAVLFVFRLGDETATRSIPLHALRPDTRYQVSFEDRAETFVARGAQLMADGLTLTLPPAGQPPTIDPNGMARASEVVFLIPAEDR